MDSLRKFMLKYIRDLNGVSLDYKIRLMSKIASWQLVYEFVEPLIMTEGECETDFTVRFLIEDQVEMARISIGHSGGFMFRRLVDCGTRYCPYIAGWHRIGAFEIRKATDIILHDPWDGTENRFRFDSPTEMLRYVRSLLKSPNASFELVKSTVKRQGWEQPAVPWLIDYLMSPIIPIPLPR